MTTLEGRPNTALLVIDVQNAILAAAAGRDGVLTNLYWSYQSAPGRTAEVVTAAEVSFTAPAEFTPLTRPVERGEMPLSGIPWRCER